MRHLATIREIQSIEPIKGKDRVELAHVDGWTCMISKADKFKAGDMCVFCEPDSVFPQEDRWEFLKKYNYRIKTQKFKDSDGNPIYSQGLVLPLSTLPEKISMKSNKKAFYLHVGDDVTALLGITQYEPPMDKEPVEPVNKKYPKWLMKYALFRKLLLPKKISGKFPDFVSKTDEERIQNCPNIVKDEDIDWIATEKLDGQSGTFAVKRHRHLFWSTYEFFVCSRNLRKPHPDSSSYWFVAKKYDIKKKLISYLKNRPELDWVAIQGECVGPNIQGNKYKLKEYDLYVFNFINSNRGRLDSEIASEIIGDMDMKFVPILGFFELVNKSVEDILRIANGQSHLADTIREGIVFRSDDGKKSFKAVSPEFLIKHNQ